MKTLYVNLKHLINEHIMLKTYCFEVHPSAISGPFAKVLRDVERNVFTFGTWLEDVKFQWISPHASVVEELVRHRRLWRWTLNLLIRLLENLLRN